MTGIRNSLTRKLGPLPIWIWAGLTGVVIFGYRSMKGQYRGGANTANTVTGEVQDGSTPQDPVTVSPGDSVYDPNTGALVSTAPDQQAADGALPGPDPLTLAPGESVYDPGTGKLLTPPARPTAAPKKPSAKRPKKPRLKKPKPHHNPSDHKARPHTHAKPTQHGSGNVTPHTTTRRVPGKGPHSGSDKRPHPAAAYGRTDGAPDRSKPRPHAAATRPVAHGTAPRTSRPRATPKPAVVRTKAPTPNSGVVRQRPAASHPTPSAVAQAHPKATPKPAPKPAARRRK